MPPVLALLMAGLVFVGCHAYLLNRFARRWIHGFWARVAVAALLTVALAFALSLSRMGLEGTVADMVSWVAYVWMGLGLLLLLTGGMLDLYLRVSRMRETRAGQESVDLNRRALITARGEKVALGVAAAGAAVGLAQARGPFRVTRTEVEIESLPASFDGYTIVQVSDIHVGPTIKGSFVQRIVDEINALDADLVAITGDLVDGSLTRLSEHVARLKGIQSKDGSFFVTGNHEYYSGGQVWVDYVRSLGIIPLMNEHRVMTRGRDQLVIGGVTDYSAHRHDASHRSDVKAAFAGTDPDLTRVLLAHQPRSVFAAAKERVDLQISGHTHNGQMFPFNFVVAMAQPYLKGLAKVVESVTPMWIYVHQGTGYWGPPNRLGIAPEVAVLTLKRPSSG